MDNGRRRSRRRVAAALAAVAAILLLCGCARLVSVSVSQDPLDRVLVTVKVCAVDNAGCPRGALPLDASTGVGQVLLGFRVPTASQPPDAFDSSDPAGVVRFAVSPSLTAELERLAPAGAGRRWVGYLSDPISYTAGSGPQAFTATAPFTLLQGPDGSPFPRPFRYQVVVGSRLSQGTLAPGRPVVCGPAALDAVSPDSSTICANSPPAATIAGDGSFATRDAGVLADAASATAAPGALAAMPFTIAYSGAGGDMAPRLSLAASTTLPGASASATPNLVIPPADGRVSALVTVNVPASAPPGRYEVRLVATAPRIFRFLPIIKLLNAETGTRSRTGVGTLVVPTPAELQGAGGVTIAKVTAAARFRRSRPRGVIVARGRATARTRLNILVRRAGAVSSLGRSPAVRRSLFRATTVRGGAFRTRIRIPAGFLPGRYRVSVAPVTAAGVALPQTSAATRIRAPREGVVDSAFVSGNRKGRSIRRFTTRPRTMFANFRFAPGALPARGTAFRLTVRWSHNGRAIGRLLPRKRRRSVAAFLRLRNHAPLPPGRYRAVLKAGRTVVAVATVGVR